LDEVDDTSIFKTAPLASLSTISDLVNALQPSLTSTIESDLVRWPIAEMTAAGRGVRLLGSSCRRRSRSAAAVFDPKASAPGKLAKNRRCKSPTGKV
jgi:hypothetical protein